MMAQTIAIMIWRQKQIDSDEKVQFWKQNLNHRKLKICANNENDDADNKPHPPGESFAAVVFQIPIVITHVVVISTRGDGGGIKGIVRGGFDLRAIQQLHHMYVIQQQNSITYTKYVMLKKKENDQNEMKTYQHDEGGEHRHG